MRVVRSEILYQGKLTAVRDTLEYPDGRCHRHETIEHPGAVVILPIMPSGSVVFVDQYRHSIRKNILELPAGTLEKGEDPRECAARELMEEIGKAPGELISLGTLFPAPGFCNEVQHLFCARNLRDQKATPDEDEFITTVELSRNEIEDSIRSGKLNDAKSLALVFRAMIDNLL
jgi:ADP-ribose pyrophosphatase